VVAGGGAVLLDRRRLVVAGGVAVLLDRRRLVVASGVAALLDRRRLVVAGGGAALLDRRRLEAAGGGAALLDRRRLVVAGDGCRLRLRCDRVRIGLKSRPPATATHGSPHTRQHPEQHQHLRAPCSVGDPVLPEHRQRAGSKRR